VKALGNRAFDADRGSGLEVALALVAAPRRGSAAAAGGRAIAEKRKPVFNAS
jgi:hypothetical protein